jgi:hypothetical protein
MLLANLIKITVKMDIVKAEFWKLKRQYRLYQIYPEIEHCLPSFLKLHRVLKGKGLNPDNVEWFANAMESQALKWYDPD